VGLGIVLGPQEASEPARIMKAQAQSIAEQEIEVVVFPEREVRRRDPEATGHAEVEDQGARIRSDQQVLAPPPHGAYP
jgi:hypothetical protein